MILHDEWQRAHNAYADEDAQTNGNAVPEQLNGSARNDEAFLID